MTYLTDNRVRELLVAISRAPRGDRRTRLLQTLANTLGHLVILDEVVVQPAPPARAA
jgi:hypothetical protein